MAEIHRPCLCCDPPRCEADKCAEVGRLYAECAPIDSAPSCDAGYAHSDPLWPEADATGDV